MPKERDLSHYLHPAFKKSQSCTISGLRPHKLPAGTSVDRLLAALERAVRDAYTDGFRVFLTGSAMGVDIWAGQIIVGLKEELSDLRLHLFIPYEGQANGWGEEWRKQYIALHALADEVLLLQFQYTKGCFHRRNRVMVDRSARVIAVHDGMADGGTAYTIGYARRWNVEVVVINPGAV